VLPPAAVMYLRSTLVVRPCTTRYLLKYMVAKKQGSNMRGMWVKEDVD